MIHLPILRKGREYRSMDSTAAVHYKTREPIAEISQANVGLIRRDLLDQSSARETLSRFSTDELIDMCAAAGDSFLNGSLPCGDSLQSPEDYVRQLSATTGMPHVMVRRNMQKIHAMFANMRTVLSGLTRGMDLAVLDQGYSSGASPVSFFPRGQSLGVVLPSNSPAVHSLWIPSIAMKTPVILKPGGSEPWTPYRIVQAFAKAGCPPEAFSYYPTDHAGSNEILRSCGRGMLFGDVGAVKNWAKDPRIELHGPGYSKIVIGDDCIDEWPKYIDVIARSIAENGGRSCVNASGVWVTAHADEIAGALAERLARIVPRAEDDPEAAIAPFASADVARRINSMVDAGLAEAGAADITARLRDSSRLAEWEGCSYLLPTVVRCETPDHSLANREFLFPFASVVEVSQSDLPEILGSTLVVSAITRDRKLIDRLLTSPLVGRLNVGPIQTNVIQWDQPHEGNLFDHLYARRAFQMAGEPAFA
jgi:acyl-CoA reductase-like NAD-dependent aldehyde dehydrogenase